jgi:WD40-like Beta Propeller Repeat
MSARTPSLTTLISLCALVGFLFLGSASSQATVSHEYLSQIAEVPAEGPHGEAIALPGPLQGVPAVSVDAGHLWTMEPASNSENHAIGRVDEFSASSHAFEFQLPWPTSLEGPTGLAVGDATGETELYVPVEEKQEPVVAVFGQSGALQATWRGTDTPATFCFENLRGCEITSVAVDRSQSLGDSAAGDVYAAAASRQGHDDDDVVDVFKPEAGGKEEYVGRLPGPEPGGFFPEGFKRYVTVDESNGDVLVAEGELTPEPVVYVFEPSAVVGQYTLVRKLTGAGTPEGSFRQIDGVAVDSSQGYIYVIDGLAGGFGEVVDQFNSEGVYLGHLTSTPKSPFASVGSVAVDPASHDVFVSDDRPERQAGFVDVFGPSIVVPDVVTGAVSGVKARSATLNGTVDPDEAGAATCHFAWGTSVALGKVAPCEPEGVADGGSAVGVHAALSGLVPDTTYYYRLQASNAAGSNPGEASQDGEFTTPGPGVEEESASAVTSVSATLGARIDPNNAATTYYFQYGTSASYGTTLPVLPGLGLGAGKGAEVVAVHLQGLAAGSTYHYRVVAVSEAGGEPVTVEAPDETFTTQAVGAVVSLPDGRAWEMVSPPNKQGSGINAVGAEQGSDVQASVEGGGITYTADSPFVADPAGSRSLEMTQVISTRRAAGDWETADISTAHDEGPTAPAIGQSAEYKLFSSDLSLGLVEPAGHTPLPPLPAGSERTIYLREADGAYKALITSGNVPTGAEFGGSSFVSASPDLSHVVVNSNVALVAGAPAAGGLYEWSEGKLQLVSVLPNKQQTSHGVLGDGGNAISGVERHAISNDGSRFVWEGEPAGDYYLRDMVRGETVQIDAAQEGLREVAGAANFRTASSDDSRVFFTSGRHLTRDSTSDSQLEDLYVFEVTSGSGEPLAGRVTDLTAVDGGEDGAVQGVIGASEDGSYVYFVAGGILGDAAEHGAEGGHYLYMEHYDAASKAWSAPQFVAALSEEDSPTWGNGNTTNLKQMTSRVSPDGRYLAFMSDRSLTGYENHDANSDEPDEEVFLYDAGTGKVVCASCNPTGGRPVGLLEGNLFDERLVDFASTWRGRWLAGNIPGWTTRSLGSASYQSRYLSDSGRLFFNSNDALVPADVNGKEDVYEYEPEGVGSCQGPAHGQSASVVFSESMGGCVGLVSAGTSSEESAFMDASETGGDVFFLTLSKLSPSDYDTSIDLYDAHECSTAQPCAATPALVPPPCTTGDACKPGPTPQPTLFGAPSSETFSGAGNIAPAEPATTTKTKTKAKAKAKAKAKSSTQKLARALKTCRKKPVRKRAGCEGLAKRRLGAKGSRARKSGSARARALSERGR